MPNINIVIETTPIYIKVTPQQPANISVKFGAVDSVNGQTGAVVIDNIPTRSHSTTSTTSLTVDIDSYDQANVTSLDDDMTIEAPVGTPTDGQKLRVRVTIGSAGTVTLDPVFRLRSGDTIPS